MKVRRVRTKEKETCEEESRKMKIGSRKSWEIKKKMKLGNSEKVGKFFRGIGE